ncbi:zinc finger CCCH domain-containing protein 47-like [Chenopodium quinoa]|uniref:zinc finger CCCH domain-containing protein 47-like n=1 Tax=Chenopodium quinoa TaxID=63459 RepID=UPI000B78FB48|nr:zinc finger CCCH domain-containing protein 47-like [Chenopodium quinoa]
MGMDISQEQVCNNTSTLLEYAASDDINSFKLAVESGGLPIDEVGVWYTRGIGTNKMSYEERTPLMVAAQYGSNNILDFVLQFGGDSVHVNRVSGSDRVTALHCAVAGGSHNSPYVVHRLISASANTNIVDANGNRASDLIHMFPKIPSKNSYKQQLDVLLKSGYSDSDSGSVSGFSSDSESDSKKEFAVSELPDINNGVYGSDDFRMYCFKIKPCSRAYTHDWTECPFAHPGENARRRDPKKYQYTCVPCPEFKKGSCKKGEECEFAHGVFESWLHPAQYRTRLCKDEIGCARKVCFFAHKREELRPVYASTGSAIPDVNVSSSPGGGFSCTSTPPMSPSFAPLSPSNGASGGAGGMYQGKSGFGVTPPNLQLPGSRLRSSFSARDVELERELIKIESQLMNQQHQYQQQQQHQHQQVLSPRPSPRWNNNNMGRANDMMQATNLESAFASINVARKMSPPSVLDSPLNSPRKLSPPRALDSPKSMAAAMLNSRAAAFVKRSQSFIDRTAPGSPMGGNMSNPMSTPMSNWGSPNGTLDWGIHGEELNKLRKSNSFGFRGANNNNANATRTSPPGFNEPDVSWVNSLVKDEAGAGFLGARSPSYGRSGAGNGAQGQDMCLPWEQMYIEEQLVN